MGVESQGPRDIPILFSGPLVRRILAGQKTQTRRLFGPSGCVPHGNDYPQYDIRELRGRLWHVENAEGGGFQEPARYGIPGDRLWVRETWKVGSWKSDGRFAIDYAAGPAGQTPWVKPPPEVATKLARESLEDCERHMERAKPDDESVWDEGARYAWEVGNSPCRWRPSIFLFRWASRITLEVTSVRVEQLQDIDEEDARAEGVEPADAMEPDSCRSAFRDLWDRINGKRATWDSNPWVWRIEFRRLP